MNKLKKCKGTGKAKNFKSCNELSVIKRYGLCSNCFRKWLLNTQAGSDYLKKNNIKAKNKIIKEKKIEKIKEKKRLKIENKSIAVLKAEAKVPFQKLIRIRDHRKTCICCDEILPYNIGDYDAGHFKKAELYSGVIFHPDNVHGQRVYCNQHLNGNESVYAERLPERIGLKKYNILVELANKTKNYKWDRYKLIELKEHYVRELNIVEKGDKSIDDVDFSVGIIN